MTTTTTSSKNNRFNDQNNSSACASRFSVRFFDVHDYEVKPPNLTFFGGRGHTTTNFPSTFWVKSLKIQLQEKWLTYWASPNKRDLVLPVNWVILCGIPGWGRTVGRTVTWLPKFLGWLDYQIFLIGMGLRSRALRGELHTSIAI